MCGICGVVSLRGPLRLAPGDRRTHDRRPASSRPRRVRSLAGRAGVAGPRPPEHHRPRRRPAAHEHRRRPLLDHLQRRGLQLPRIARRTRRPRGRVFRTRCDTEVILQAYARVGRRLRRTVQRAIRLRDLGPRGPPALPGARPVRRAAAVPRARGRRAGLRVRGEGAARLARVRAPPRRRRASPRSSPTGSPCRRRRCSRASPSCRPGHVATCRGGDPAADAAAVAAAGLPCGASLLAPDLPAGARGHALRGPRRSAAR